MQHDINNIEDAYQYAAAHGIKLSANDYRQIAELQQLQSELEFSAIRQQQGWFTAIVETFNRQYPNFLKFLHRAGDVIITFMQTIIVAIGNPAILLLLLWVEHARVVYGLKLFEASDDLAWLGAWAIVLLNLTLEFTVHYVEHRAGYNQERPSRFSLRSWWGSVRYFLGIGRDWKPKLLSPAQQYRNLSKVVTATILILALAGSMREAITKVSLTQEAVSAAPVLPGTASPVENAPTWYDAMWSIVSESTLLEMATWSSGLVFALAAILGVQKTASYIAIRCAEIVRQNDRARMQTSNQSAAIQYIVAKVAERQMKNAPPLEQAEAVRNGNGHYHG